MARCVTEQVTAQSPVSVFLHAVYRLWLCSPRLEMLSVRGRHVQLDSSPAEVTQAVMLLHCRLSCDAVPLDAEVGRFPKRRQGATVACDLFPSMLLGHGSE